MGWKITPRAPEALVSLRKRRSLTDGEAVIEAREHLLQLLQDPYYWEAMQELISEKHWALKPWVGRKPKRGTRAGQIQRENEKKPRGRPASSRSLNLRRRKLAEALMQIGKAKSFKDAARLIAKAKDPELSDRKIEAIATHIGKSMADGRQIKRKRKIPSIEG